MFASPARPQRMRLEVDAVIALGSNQGDRAALIADAVRELDAAQGVRITACSPLYETPALKPTGIDVTAPSYLNAVALARVAISPTELLALANRIEADHGRVREEVWGDRTLDIDIIDFGQVVSDDPHLTLPHPRAHERAFVLAPWLAVDPHAQLVGHGPVKELLAERQDPVSLWVGERAGNRGEGPSETNREGQGEGRGEGPTAGHGLGHETH